MRVLGGKSEYDDGNLFNRLGVVQMSADGLALQLDELIQDLQVRG